MIVVWSAMEDGAHGLCNAIFFPQLRNESRGNLDSSSKEIG